MSLSREDRRRLPALVLGGALSAAAGLAQPAAQPSPTPERETPTLEQIMSHPEWIGRGPTASVWAIDSQSVFWSRPAPLADGVDLREDEILQVDLTGAVIRTLGPADETAVPSPFRAAQSRDGRRRLESRDGDLFLVDLASGETTQLTRTAAAERPALFLDDGRIAFLRDRQVFARDLGSGLEEQLFDVRFEKDPLAELDEQEEKADYLRRQQSRYFDWVRDQAARDRRRFERTVESHADPARPPRPFYLGDRREGQDLWPGPDGRALLVTVTAKDRNEGKRDQMPSYVTPTGWVETVPVRPKVGTDDGSGETLLLLDSASHEVVEIDLSPLPAISDDPLADLRARAEAARKERADETGDAVDEEGDENDADGDGDDGEKDDGEANDDDEAKPRAVRFERVLWPAGSGLAVVQAISVDNKDRWIFALDLASRAVRPLHHRRDPAWINWSFRDLDLLPDGRTLYLLSEQSGWSQLYLLDPVSGSLRRLTDGDFVVDAATPSPDGRFLYFTANPEHPGRYDVYRVAVPGDGAAGAGPVASERITALGGVTELALSPDGETLLLTHSTPTRPPDLYLQAATPGAEARRLTETVSEEFAAIDWVEPRIVDVPSSHHDRPIVSRLYLPDEDAPTLADGRRPAVMFVHGAGYLQNAHAHWSSYFREFMFHTLLAREGYVVLDMDYRGSAGYGRDWRTAIYRNMGWPEVEDLADGVAYLAAEHGVDPARVGVYGGSYGGFLTMMALFTQPDLFAAGAALRPVTDWAHYNHPYTSNILNTPEVDPEAYERSSPIEHAEGLEKPLLIATGMLDDNVLFQDSVRLVQRLIELEKEDWWIAVYPVEPHGFREPSSWLDEYRRIHDLFERYLLPGGGGR